MLLARVLFLCAAFLGAFGAPTALAARGEQTPLNLPDERSEGGEAAASSTGSGLLRLFVGMLVIVGIVLAVRWLLKTYARSKFPGLSLAADAIELLATKPLGPNRALHVVRLGEETLLIGSSEHAITSLGTVPAEAAGRLFPPSGGTDFESALGAALTTPPGRQQRRTQWGGFDSLVARLRESTVRRG